MLEDLLLEARGGSGAHPLTFRYPAEKSLFPIVAGSLLVEVLLLGRLIRYSVGLLL